MKSCLSIAREWSSAFCKPRQFCELAYLELKKVIDHSADLAI